MKKLYSGTYQMGICGKPTELVDSFGETLFIGDLVVIYNVERNQEISAGEPEYVVQCDDENPFIMGLKSCQRVTHYYLDGDEATKNKYDWKEDIYISEEGYEWLVKKVKSHQKTVDGEVWGSGNVTVREEE